MPYHPIRAAVLAIAVAACGCTPAPREVLRVATINVAHGRGASMNPLGQLARSRAAIERNLVAVAECVAREAPDVVALQEADAASDWSGDFDHVSFLAEAAGYPHRFHGQHVQFDLAGVTLRYGTALLARRPLADAQSFVFQPERGEPGKGFVASRIALADRPVLVVSVHLHSQNADARRRQADFMIKRIERLREASPQPGLVLMGDFNSAWNRSDSAVRRIAEQLRLQAFEPQSADLHTYPSVRPQNRIDWILISSDLEFRDYRCWPDAVSDHLGVTAELSWR